MRPTSRGSVERVLAQPERPAQGPRGEVAGALGQTFAESVDALRRIALQQSDIEHAVIQARIDAQRAVQPANLAPAGGLAEESHGGSQVDVDNLKVTHAHSARSVKARSLDRRRSPDSPDPIFRPPRTGELR